VRRQLEPNPSFDYGIATEAEILARAQLLESHVMGDIVGARFTASEAKRGKGEVGAAIEHFFGIPSNPRQEADFPSAGIELKVVPLLRSAQGIRVKERTVISMIGYDGLMLETWDSASVRKKLKILFLFFEHLPDQPKSNFPIRGILLWEPDQATESFIHADWDRVFTKVRQGAAHLLSESDGRILGPCTKGPNAGVLRPQPFGDELATSRAFALKPVFTLELYQRLVRGRKEESLVADKVTSPTAEFEERLLQRFSVFEGRTVSDVADELGVPPSKAKSYAAQVTRRAFGAKDFRSPIREFAAMGITPRIIRIDSNLMPYEALSFPAFRYMELLQETWEDSDLLSRIEYMLIVPVHGETKETPQTECRFGHPFFWRPSASELETIRQEWEIYRLEIREGRAAHLTPASKTAAIHVRPHARSAADVDLAPRVGPVVKKSFWLNRSFLQQLLRSRPQDQRRSSRVEHG
jgi:DNA mismatch repair endonuclease MutH